MKTHLIWLFSLLMTFVIALPQAYAATNSPSHELCKTFLTRHRNAILTKGIRSALRNAGLERDGAGTLELGLYQGPMGLEFSIEELKFAVHKRGRFFNDEASAEAVSVPHVIQLLDALYKNSDFVDEALELIDDGAYRLRYDFTVVRADAKAPHRGALAVTRIGAKCDVNPNSFPRGFVAGYMRQLIKDLPNYEPLPTEVATAYAVRFRHRSGRLAWFGHNSFEIIKNFTPRRISPALNYGFHRDLTAALKLMARMNQFDVSWTVTQTGQKIEVSDPYIRRVAEPVFHGFADVGPGEY